MRCIDRQAYRAFPFLLLLCLAAQGQQLTKEYIRLGGRVIAVEYAGGQLTAGTIVPGSGSGARQIFTGDVTDTAGYASVDRVQIVVQTGVPVETPSSSRANGCSAIYDGNTGRISEWRHKVTQNEFRAFIPPASVGGFRGDNRSFSSNPNASSRVSVTVRVETDPQKNNARPLLGSPNVQVSPTHLNLTNGERTSTGPMMPVVSATRDKNGNVSVNVQENLRNPYTSFGGGIQSNLNFTVNQSATTATVDGTVSGSPVFEANFSVNGSENQNVPLQNAPTGTLPFALGLQQTNQISQTVQLKKKEDEEKK